MDSKEHFDEVADDWNNKVWAKDKDFASAIVDFAGLRGDEIALYVGVGTGEIATRFNVEVMNGLDVSKNMLSQNKVLKKHRLIVGSVNDIPYLDNTFDFVFARNLLKHVQNPTKAIGEMKRVLKPGGTAMTAESCVLFDIDKVLPNFCVRTVEPDHNSFQTHDEIIGFYKDNNFESIVHTLYNYKSKWLKKWVKSSKADDYIKEMILNKYKLGNQDFLDRHKVKFTDDGDIESIIFWSFVKAVK